MIRRLILVALFALSLPWQPASASSTDAAGAADHPAVPRFPGFYIDDFTSQSFNRHEFITGVNARTGDFQISGKEGKYLQNTYFLKEGARNPSVIEVIRNYENAFRRAGGALVWFSLDDYKATYRQKDGAGERWVEVELNSRADWMRLTVIDVSAMEQKVEVSAGEMLEALNRDGFIALRGILFDSGKDLIKPESEPLLREVLGLLNGTPALRLSIDGHTDNVGNPSANLALSKRRAEAVRNWLVGQGVSANRLSAQGFGDTRPVADNRAEEGRARNRRVELVKPK
jgi:OOP family OmpA-OmpF porin